jgi:glycosyltransferase involved in cell wall biosynthesis
MDRLAPRIAILTNVVPSYRQGFYDRLFARDDVSVHVYCQAELPGTNVKAIHADYPKQVTVIRARSMKGEALVWQHTPWRELLSGYDVVFVDGNPRILSHALAATLLRVLGRNVVLWTMAHSFGANRFSERVRLLWTRAFGHIFLYTDAEVRALRTRGFARHALNAMNNGLDQTRIDRVRAGWDEGRLVAWRSSNGLVGRTVLLSCTRLDPKNKLELMMQALPAVRHACPDVMWCLVGGGSEEGRLRSLAQELSVSEHVRFAGELYDEEDLAPWFLSAQALVHPGAIGLTLLHAFGYGLAVVTNGNAGGHGPEFGAFESGLSGRTFREGDADDLARTLIELLQNRPALEPMRAHVLEIVRERSNVDVMVERFVATARRAAGLQEHASASASPRQR